MADNARTEARRRIAEVVATHPRTHSGGNCLCGWVAVDNPHGEHVADALLALFPDVWRQEFVDANPAWGERPSRRPILAGPWEPVVPEEPQP